MKVRIANRSTRTILVCGVYLAPKKSIVVDWDTLSYTTQNSVNSLANLGIVKITFLNSKKEQQIEEAIEEVEETLEEPKSTKRTRKSK